MIRSLFRGAALSIFFFGPPVYASFLVTNTLDDPKTIDFSQVSGTPITWVDGPIQIGSQVGENIEMFGDPNEGLYVYSGETDSGWHLISNGIWQNTDTPFAGANLAEPGSLYFAFNDGPVSAVGGFMNYCPDPTCTLSGVDEVDLTISALDAFLQVLEIYNVSELADIQTPDGINEGAFRGIQRSSNDIYYFQIYGAVQVVDELAFSRAVPIAPTAWLLTLVLGVFGYLAQRKRIT